jgi:hypothetical protein
MHLLNVHTYELELFHGDDIPLNAILSHTWDEDEVTFQDVKNGALSKQGVTGASVGRTKILKTWGITASHGLDYAWIDVSGAVPQCDCPKS